MSAWTSVAQSLPSVDEDREGWKRSAWVEVWSSKYSLPILAFLMWSDDVYRWRTVFPVPDFDRANSGPFFDLNYFTHWREANVNGPSTLEGAAV